MATTVDDVLAAAGGLLIDPDRIVNTDDRIIPLLNKAYRELQRKHNRNGISTAREATAPVDVPANTVALVDGGLLPSDLLTPISMYERANGSTSAEDWVLMTEQDWEPNLIPTDTLQYWAWREDEIKLVGATVIREVLIKYWKSLPAFDDANDLVLIKDSLDWLAAKTAAIAALVIHSNPTRAKIYNDDAAEIYSDLIGTAVNRKQGRPVRRRRTRYRTPSWRTQ